MFFMFATEMLKNPKGSPLLALQGYALAGRRRANSVQLLGFSGTEKENI